MDPSFPFGAAIIGAAVGALTLFGVAALTRSRRASAPAAAPPPAADPEVLRVHPEVAAAIADLAVVRAEWTTYRKQLEQYLEAFLDIEETIERKRRRTAASASRAAAAEQHQEQPANGRADLINRARAQGLPV